MRLFECECGATLFFHNTTCMTCQRQVGFCPACHRMTTVEQGTGETFRCSHEDCQSELWMCQNYFENEICNWCVVIEPGEDQSLCRSCELTRVIPDLSVDGNKQRWSDLERAKRRMLYTLDLLGLTYDDQQGRLPLSFEFKGDPIGDQTWHHVAGGGQVYTGHQHGVITINIREADSVQREETRVQMGEELRTLIGHFRHEIGHYFWERLVENRFEPQFVTVFGDHNHPPYAEAKDAYYANGAPADWRDHFVSAYASMHSWEDFAETFAAYQDIIAMLDTAGHVGLIEPVDFSAMTSTLISTYQRLGVGINEMNREMGLPDPAPFVLTGEISEKLDFIHALVHGQLIESVAQPTSG